MALREAKLREETYNAMRGAGFSSEAVVGLARLAIDTQTDANDMAKRLLESVRLSGETQEERDEYTKNLNRALKLFKAENQTPEQRQQARDALNDALPTNTHNPQLNALNQAIKDDLRIDKEQTVQVKREADTKAAVADTKVAVAANARQTVSANNSVMAGL